jgi:hypothetical protein
MRPLRWNSDLGPRFVAFFQPTLFFFFFKLIFILTRERSGRANATSM